MCGLGANRFYVVIAMACATTKPNGDYRGMYALLLGAVGFVAQAVRNGQNCP